MESTAIARRPDIRPRNIEFELTEDLPRHWHSGDPFITHFFNGLSLMFPEGERFFMDSVRRFQGEITDPKLRENVRGFLAQEGIHGREHRRMNDLLEHWGYPVKKIDAWLERGLRFDRMLGTKWQLAMTCALEHFTAIFADIALSDSRLFDGAHPEFARLWRWHAVEETEHKAVAFDVYKTVAPGLIGYLRRVVVMAITSVLFVLQIAIHAFLLERHDGVAGNFRGRRRATRFFWKDPGFIPMGLRPYLRYYSPGFHPWQHDNGVLVERWKAQYAGAAAPS
jgi:uncharacterized protein